MNRILCYLNRGCTCQNSRHLRWLERMKRIVEQVETAADLESGFELFTPSLSSLLEGNNDRSVRLCFFSESDGIEDIDNLPAITAEIIRDYAGNLLEAASRIDASGKGLL